MVTDSLLLTINDVTRLVDLQDRQKLRLVLNDMHPADLAEKLTEIDKEHRIACFRLLDLDNAGAVLAQLTREDQVELLRDLGDFGVVPIVSQMSPDDAADLLLKLPREKTHAIIEQMTDLEAAKDIVELMTFKDDSAGGIMSTDYLALHAHMTVEEALHILREAYTKLEEEVYDIYVVDSADCLVGKLSVKDLLTAPTSALVESIMEQDVFKVLVTDDQNKAAEKLSRYDLLSLPVTDQAGKLRGIITADDVIDVIKQEATQDIYQSAGVSTDSGDSGETLTYRVRTAFKARLPWLFVTICIEAGSASVISHFDVIIRQAVMAAAFMPLLSAVTGSVAVQSTCIVVRNSANEQLPWKALKRILWHETRVGMTLGLTCALITALVSYLLTRQSIMLGLIIGSSLFVTMIVGVIMGTSVPLIFEKLGFDPAHASGPLITSLLDVFTFTIYLAILSTSLAHLL